MLNFIALTLDCNCKKARALLKATIVLNNDQLMANIEMLEAYRYFYSLDLANQLSNAKATATAMRPKIQSEIPQIV